MASRLIVAGVLLVLCTACGTARMVRLDTGQGEPLLLLTRTEGAGPVALQEEELTRALTQEAQRWRPSANPERAARELFDVSPSSGWYGYSPRRGVVALDGQPPDAQWAQVDMEVTQQYLQFCQAKGQSRDCRRVLINSPVLTGDSRYALAMSFAMDGVVPEMMEAFQGMADPEAIKASILWTMTIYAAMWLAPEPVFSKGLGTVVTAAFICYVGVDTFWTLIQGWRRMVEEADNAASFAYLREAGERYARVMGRNAARAFALLLTVAVGQTASGFSAKVPTLPGSAQASVAGAGQVRVRLAEVAQVESVAVSADVITIALAPNAVASLAHGSRGAAAAPADEDGQWHHIATDKWSKDTRSGGPWTPRFQELFDRAGMSLKDPANKVRVRGHRGPHPEEYHEEVYERLRRAIQDCRSIQQCQQALKAELRELAREIATQDSHLNKLLTRSE